MPEKTPNIIIVVYGQSGSGKTDFIKSHPELFDRADIAIHGHPKELAGFHKARKIGYEQGVASDVLAFKEVLESAAIRLVAVDEAAQAEASFGPEFAAQIRKSAKPSVLLFQEFDEALEFVGKLGGREDRLHWGEVPLEPQNRAGAVEPADLVLIPIGCREGIKAIVRRFLAQE